MFWLSPFSSSFSPDNITYRSGPVWLTGLHQPPGAEDLSVQPPTCTLWLPSSHPGRLGDPQRLERQAFLLQPCHWRAHLEAPTHQGHERQHQQHQRRQPGHSGEWGGRDFSLLKPTLHARNMHQKGHSFVRLQGFYFKASYLAAWTNVHKTATKSTFYSRMQKVRPHAEITDSRYLVCMRGIFEAKATVVENINSLWRTLAINLKQTGCGEGVVDLKGLLNWCCGYWR